MTELLDTLVALAMKYESWKTRLTENVTIVQESNDCDLLPNVNLALNKTGTIIQGLGKSRDVLKRCRSSPQETEPPTEEAIMRVATVTSYIKYLNYLDNELREKAEKQEHALNSLWNSVVEPADLSEIDELPGQSDSPEPIPVKASMPAQQNVSDERRTHLPGEMIKQNPEDTQMVDTNFPSEKGGLHQRETSPFSEDLAALMAYEEEERAQPGRTKEGVKRRRLGRVIEAVSNEIPAQILDNINEQSPGDTLMMDLDIPAEKSALPEIDASPFDEDLAALRAYEKEEKCEFGRTEDTLVRKPSERVCGGLSDETSSQHPCDINEQGSGDTQMLDSDLPTEQKDFPERKVSPFDEALEALRAYEEEEENRSERPKHTPDRRQLERVVGQWHQDTAQMSMDPGGLPVSQSSSAMDQLFEADQELQRSLSEADEQLMDGPDLVQQRGKWASSGGDVATPSPAQSATDHIGDDSKAATADFDKLLDQLGTIGKQMSRSQASLGNLQSLDQVLLEVQSIKNIPRKGKAKASDTDVEQDDPQMHRLQYLRDAHQRRTDETENQEESIMSLKVKPETNHVKSSKLGKPLRDRNQMNATMDVAQDTNQQSGESEPAECKEGLECRVHDVSFAQGVVVLYDSADEMDLQLEVKQELDPSRVGGDPKPDTVQDVMQQTIKSQVDVEMPSAASVYDEISTQLKVLGYPAKREVGNSISQIYPERSSTSPSIRPRVSTHGVRTSRGTRTSKLARRITYWTRSETPTILDSIEEMLDQEATWDLVGSGLLQIFEEQQKISQGLQADYDELDAEHRYDTAPSGRRKTRKSDAEVNLHRAYEQMDDVVCRMTVIERRLQEDEQDVPFESGFVETESLHSTPERIQGQYKVEPATVC